MKFFVFMALVFILSSAQAREEGFLGECTFSKNNLSEGVRYGFTGKNLKDPNSPGIGESFFLFDPQMNAFVGGLNSCNHPEFYTPVFSRKEIGDYMIFTASCNEGGGSWYTYMVKQKSNGEIKYVFTEVEASWFAAVQCDGLSASNIPKLSSKEEIKKVLSQTPQSELLPFRKRFIKQP